MVPTFLTSESSWQSVNKQSEAKLSKSIGNLSCGTREELAHMDVPASKSCSDLAYPFKD